MFSKIIFKCIIIKFENQELQSTQHDSDERFTIAQKYTAVNYHITSLTL